MNVHPPLKIKKTPRDLQDAQGSKGTNGGKGLRFSSLNWRDLDLLHNLHNIQCSDPTSGSLLMHNDHFWCSSHYIRSHLTDLKEILSSHPSKSLNWILVYWKQFTALFWTKWECTFYTSNRMFSGKENNNDKCLSGFILNGLMGRPSQNTLLLLKSLSVLKKIQSRCKRKGFVCSVSEIFPTF